MLFKFYPVNLRLSSLFRILFLFLFLFSFHLPDFFFLFLPLPFLFLFFFFSALCLCRLFIFNFLLLIFFLIFLNFCVIFLWVTLACSFSGSLSQIKTLGFSLSIQVLLFLEVSMESGGSPIFKKYFFGILHLSSLVAASLVNKWKEDWRRQKITDLHELLQWLVANWKTVISRIIASVHLIATEQFKSKSLKANQMNTSILSLILITGIFPPTLWAAV